MQSICALCGGDKREGTTTVTSELGVDVVVIRNVPALVGTQCGEDWLTDDIAVRIEKLVEAARAKRCQVEVTTL